MDIDEDDVLRCAICGTAEGDSSNLSSQTSLQTNATVRCGHQFCNACLDRELVRKREFPCPTCETPVKRVNLSKLSLDRVQCERDNDWRKRIKSVYNKTETDFPTLTAYNDYLEEVEDMIYAIVNEEPRAEEIKNHMKQYKQEHNNEINIRGSQRADEERSILDRIAAEQRMAEQSRLLALEEEKSIAAAKKKFKMETTEVLLGEREEVGAELKQAQMQGYRNELKRQQLRAGGKSQAAAQMISPRVREPPDGLKRDEIDRQLYLKRQAAGGGIPIGSIQSQERQWKETEQTLFARMRI